ncbi:MAG: MFS transporter [Xanthobacteraceae bacterium]
MTTAPASGLAAASGRTATFYGWHVVAAVFVLATFGWGLGFYGPAVYLHAVQQSRGWSLNLVSTAVTVHFLFGAIVIANLPRLYARFGVARVTKAGVVALALGVTGWALAQQPWELFVATLFSGGGWVTMGAAAVNAILAPWFVRRRPAALASAYNGSSIGGVVFSPLWVAAIGLLGFAWAAIVIGLIVIGTIWILADLYYSKTPQAMGLQPDGDAPQAVATALTKTPAKPLPNTQVWKDWRLVTLAAGMALGLFAQIGLLAHLFSLLVPALGAQLAGFAVGGATAAAIVGRTLVGWLMPADADRRLFGCGNSIVQILGSLAFLFAAGDNVPLLLLGVVLFGAGIGNTTSLPPMIAQAEFSKEDVSRVVPLIVATGQATYAFAPAVFGLIREFAPPWDTASAGAAPWLFIAAALVQALAAVAFFLGRQRKP